MFYKYPIFGVGLGNYPFYIDKYSNIFFYAGYAHNDYVEILSTTGIVGMIVYILIYYNIIKNILALKGKEKLLGIMLITFFLADNYFKPNYYNKLFYFSLILIVFRDNERVKSEE